VTLLPSTAHSATGAPSPPGGTAGLKDSYPVRWAGRQAVVTLPEHIGAANAGQIREELLAVINRGAEIVIADMITTISCDQAGTDAVVRACQRAVLSGAELRLVVAARTAWRRLSLSGLDGLDGVVSIYPSLAAAVAAGPPDETAVPPAEQVHRSLELLDTRPFARSAIRHLTPSVSRPQREGHRSPPQANRRSGYLNADSRAFSPTFGSRSPWQIGRSVLP